MAPLDHLRDENESALIVEGDFDVDPLEIRALPQSEPAADRFADRLLGIASLDAVMLCVCLEESAPSQLVIPVHCDKWRFDWPVRCHQDDRTCLLPLQMPADVFRHILKPVLRPARNPAG